MTAARFTSWLERRVWDDTAREPGVFQLIVGVWVALSEPLNALVGRQFVHLALPRGVFGVACIVAGLVQLAVKERRGRAAGALLGAFAWGVGAADIAWSGFPFGMIMPFLLWRIYLSVVAFVRTTGGFDAAVA